MLMYISPIEIVLPWIFIQIFSIESEWGRAATIETKRSRGGEPKFTTAAPNSTSKSPNPIWNLLRPPEYTVTVYVTIFANLASIEYVQGRLCPIITKLICWLWGRTK